MKLGPSFDQASLRARQRARDQLHRFNPKHSHRVLVIGMKVRQMMGLADFHKHSNDQAEEPGNLRHSQKIPSGL